MFGNYARAHLKMYIKYKVLRNETSRVDNRYI